MVEMEEVAYILLHATKNSLILMDELGRGTSTSDGIRIAYSVIRYLHEHIHAKTICSTHYHELMELEKDCLHVVTGDFNGDGDMDNKDVVLSMQNILEIIPADEYQSVAIDVTGDGIVNNRDCAKMAQYLVGKVEL